MQFQGKRIRHRRSLNKYNCWLECKAMDTCTWISFEPREKMCVYYETCDEVEAIKNFTSSQVQCDFQPSKIGKI